VEAREATRAAFRSLPKASRCPADVRHARSAGLPHLPEYGLWLGLGTRRRREKWISKHRNWSLPAGQISTRTRRNYCSGSVSKSATRNSVSISCAFKRLFAVQELTRVPNFPRFHGWRNQSSRQGDPHHCVAQALRVGAASSRRASWCSKFRTWCSGSS
jgi:hypothetical protein